MIKSKNSTNPNHNTKMTALAKNYWKRFINKIQDLIYMVNLPRTFSKRKDTLSKRITKANMATKTTTKDITPNKSRKSYMKTDTMVMKYMTTSSMKKCQG